MSYQDILVHLDAFSGNEKRLRFAVGLAKGQQARLIGLHVAAPPETPAEFPLPISQEILEMQMQAVTDRAAKLEAAFAAATERQGLATEWRFVVHPDPVGQIAMNARYCDLTILGQPDPDAGGLAADDELPDRVILDVGRPVLVFPYVGSYAGDCGRILVAWDAGHAATRAVHDALPLLARAEQVTVLSIDPKHSPSAHGDVVGGDICSHLAHHGVKAEAAEALSADIDVGNRLLSYAADRQADLLVMGAYGHHRLRDWMIGGATREVMEHMTLPVLMSH